ncbi:lysophospholipid acyltransferase family protein [Roseovarius nanhaiticus]|uniref:KDO2-lipid IV(A) lauroyltransferase n=1 Tax=Roseovarius nanhaiticus TaxID=573024 RepID=A0A1N7F8Q9_9RHOB|nr:lysophospholipid acyltransferase family protein [Roseovarius nanhaiticus]SEK59325.1 KDO2-lipid IV(A) lauroyltransferase [Roseovarius nanhaiticus]SIR96723.1 KDO2-lipid IV(A) lauroyltransferase [Roseovarius nanhaiticus]
MSTDNDTPKDPLTQRAGEYAVNIALRSLIALAGLMPYRWRIPALGWMVSRIVGPLAGYTARVRENLALAMPDLPEDEVRRLMRRVPDNAGRNMMEMYSAREFSERARHSPVTGPGLPAIQAARAEGRPVIFVTGHLGSFNAARVAMVEQGFEMGVFYRPMKNRYFNVHYTKAMGSLSQPMFEQGRRGMVQMTKHLRGGGVLAILNDLNAHGGVPLDFFGQPALTSLVTAELALKFDAPLVPVWGIRRENGLDFDIHVEEPIAPGDPVEMTREFNARLERIVRAHMDQWFWIHRRWKDGTGDMADRGAVRMAEMQGGGDLPQ